MRIILLNSKNMPQFHHNGFSFVWTAVYHYVHYVHSVALNFKNHCVKYKRSENMAKSEHFRHFS
jgi:hypothetical protein